MLQFLWLSIWVYVSPPVSTQFRYCILQYVLLDFIFIARKRSLGQGNIFSSVCQEFCSQGVCLSTCWDTIPPRTRHPPSGADTLLEQAPPRSRHLLGPGTPPPGADTPPGPGTPPRSRPPWEQTLPAQCMLGDTVNKRAVCILLECNLVIIFIGFF